MRSWGFCEDVGASKKHGKWEFIHATRIYWRSLTPGRYKLVKRSDIFIWLAMVETHSPKTLPILLPQSHERAELSKEALNTVIEYS